MFGWIKQKINDELADKWMFRSASWWMNERTEKVIKNALLRSKLVSAVTHVMASTLVGWPVSRPPLWWDDPCHGRCQQLQMPPFLQWQILVGSSPPHVVRLSLMEISTPGIPATAYLLRTLYIHLKLLTVVCMCLFWLVCLVYMHSVKYSYFSKLVLV